MFVLIVSRPFQCESWKTASDFHRDVAESLQFPSYYGANLDAFNDSLSDVEVPLNGGLVLVFHRFDLFAVTERKVAEAALDIIATNSRRFLLEGRRLLCLVQSNDPQLNFPPVGAEPVLWNPREWLDKARR
jgi:RNAse (barnase) inhibitor barstar